MKNRDDNQGDEINKMEDYVFVDHSVCKSELTLTGYYDTNGFFVIAGYCDRHGKFVEDDKLPVNIKKINYYIFRKQSIYLQVWKNS